MVNDKMEKGTYRGEVSGLIDDNGLGSKSTFEPPDIRERTVRYAIRAIELYRFVQIRTGWSGPDHCQTVLAGRHFDRSECGRGTFR
jgi:hypothetical protein